MVAEIVQKHDKLITRLLEIMPGLLTWGFLLSPLWLGLINPELVIYLLAFLTVYWAYLAIKTTVGLIIGYPKYKQEMQTNWLEELRKLDFSTLPEKETLPNSLEQTKHFIVIPTVNEPKEVLKPSIDAIYNQTLPTKQIALIYSVEEKYFEQVKQTILEILGPRINDFHAVKIYCHPAGIPGEAIGSGGGNRTWGARHAVADLINEYNPPKDFIFTSFDSDHVPDPQYLARLTHLYLTEDKRNNKFFTTAVHLFNNNYWQVPWMMRIESNFITLGKLSHSSIFWEKAALTTDTFASFSTSLQTLIDIDYWDVSSGADDITFYFRAFFKRKGDFVAAKHYIPYSADAVQGKTYIQSHKSLYKQLLRWGWGVVAVPISVKGFLTEKDVPFGKKFLWTIEHIKARSLLISIVFLITFGFAMLTLINPVAKQSSFAYSLPDLMSYILTFTLIFLFPPIYYRAKLIPKMPKHWSRVRRFFGVVEGAVVMVNLLTFSFFPLIEAQTRMMLGKKMKDVYHTPKMRAPKN